MFLNTQMARRGLPACRQGNALQKGQAAAEPRSSRSVG
ncbi:hypothetical protein Salmuc_02391 [Salipiger mucosus DSM 16094]|uniref:Uncharacterized protein n=1 Tax=Salipiger mucosus DSM 16094 TaxID=1123237 RepID=S9QKQ7_9RHOB|nr:hypothetical protein Salmuc_02391 [Salipiger mucosus DSM 16094]